MKLTKSAASNKLVFLVKTAKMHKESSLGHRLLRLLARTRMTARPAMQGVKAIGDAAAATGRGIGYGARGLYTAADALGKVYGRAASAAPLTTGIATGYLGSPIISTALDFGIKRPAVYWWDKKYPTPVMNMPQK